MTFWKIVTLACAFSILVEAKWQKQKRTVPSNICDPVHNNTNLVQCYCTADRNSKWIRSADCYLTDPTVPPEHKAWNAFKTLKMAEKITFTNTKGIPLTYVPTNAIKKTTSVRKLEIKYGLMELVDAYVFANASSITDLTLRDNKITSLCEYAFANHKNLNILSLDQNEITEINREVFVNLPSLEKLYLTNNLISTIHDRAFIHLVHLKELEIDRNKVFSLNSATFVGLKSLTTLDLSSNALEVIGDNTFEALENLQYLNLDENKIQMIDHNAFSGLGKLLSLSLARNKLIEIKNERVFDGLHSLKSLSLRGNQLKEIQSSAVAPIISNFYADGTNFDVEENNFPCDCKLDWFISLMNKTHNKYLQMSIENFKCIPDQDLQDAWKKVVEAAEAAKKSNKTEKKNDQNNEDELPPNDYEYYDETQLDGKLFYLDVRDLLLCENNTAVRVTTIDTRTKSTPDELKVTITDTTTKSTPDELNVTTIDTTKKSTPDELKAATIKRDNNEKDFTTTRLATVSAKPENRKIYEDMASDEGRPDKINSHRSIQDEIKETKNSAPKFVGANLFILVLLLSLDALISYY